MLGGSSVRDATWMWMDIDTDTGGVRRDYNSEGAGVDGSVFTVSDRYQGADTLAISAVACLPARAASSAHICCVYCELTLLAFQCQKINRIICNIKSNQEAAVQ